MAILNSFTSNTTISSSTMNATLADIGAEITNSLPRDGQAAMTAALRAYAGTLSAPGIAFGVDTSTGIRRSAGGAMRHVSSGTDIVEISSSGLTMVAGRIVDANSYTVVGTPAGVVCQYIATSAPTGWVRCNGRTIGSASSGATERANADTEDLYWVLWNAFANNELPIQDSSGSLSSRGVDAATDFAANKRMPLPDLRGRAFFGLDTMGSSAASRLGSIITNSTTNGATGGAETIVLLESQMPNHTHPAGSLSGSVSVTSTVSNIQLNTAGLVAAAGASGTVPLSNAGSVTSTGTATMSGSVGGAGSGAAHSNMPPAFLGTFIIKL